jgi:hypothetical protein
MIKVEGQDTGVLSRRVRHHVQQILPLKYAFMDSLVFESPLAKDDEVHVLRQSSTGPASFGLYLADGRQFHFRLGAGYSIAVKDAYHNGTVIINLDTEPKCRNFARKLK